jgi:hypothetical protein
MISDGVQSTDLRRGLLRQQRPGGHHTLSVSLEPHGAINLLTAPEGHWARLLSSVWLPRGARRFATARGLWVRAAVGDPGAGH